MTGSAITSVSAQLRLSTSWRRVERELHTDKMKAVRSDHGEWPWQNLAAVATPDSRSSRCWPRWSSSPCRWCRWRSCSPFRRDRTSRAQSNTNAAMLAQQKMEQLRGLTWGYDILGLPVSDYATDTAPATPSPAARPLPGGRHGPVAVAVGHAAAEHSPAGWTTSIENGCILGGGGTARGRRLHPALVRGAAAQQPEQHGDSAGTRDPAHRSRRADAGNVARMPDEARLMSVKTRKTK